MSDLERVRSISAGGFTAAVIFRATVDSTNNEARGHVSTGAALPFVVVAEEQTAGRGRMGRPWNSDPGLGIWMTIAVEHRRPMGEHFVFTFVASLAVALAVEEITGVQVQLKWPNDVMIHQRKCCGILLETLPSITLIGIGLNVNHTAFPSDLQSSATSLRLETGHVWPRAELLTRTVEHMLNLKDRPVAQILNQWKRKASFLGSEVTVYRGEEILRGQAVDVAIDGGLILDSGGQKRAIYAGDVQLRLN